MFKTMQLSIIFLFNMSGTEDIDHLPAKPKWMNVEHPAPLWE